MEVVIDSVIKNWKLYLIEAWALGMFMVSACVFVILVEHPYFGFSAFVHSAFIRRMFIGLAMGITAVVLIYSPLGKLSGAHMNPAVTLANYQLDRISAYDATWYILAQTVGATFFVLIFKFFAESYIADSTVNFVITIPGAYGVSVAFVAEFLLSFTLLIAVLVVNNSKWAKYTGFVAGTLVFLFIWLEAPLSGMSINPARSFGSAIVANNWTSFWLYLIAPIGGMQMAAYIYRKIYFNAKGECKSMNFFMSGAKNSNKIQQLFRWYQKDTTGKIIEHKI